MPCGRPETEALEEEFPGSLPACVVTRAKAREAKYEKMTHLETPSSPRRDFFQDLDKEMKASDDRSKPVLSHAAVISEQKADTLLGDISQDCTFTV